MIKRRFTLVCPRVRISGRVWIDGEWTACPLGSAIWIYCWDTVIFMVDVERKDVTVRVGCLILIKPQRKKLRDHVSTQATTLNNLVMTIYST